MGNNDFKHQFLRSFHILSYRHNQWEVWNDFIFLCASAISNRFDKKNFEEREKEYLRIINKYNEQERNLFPKLFARLVLELENNTDQDLLGSLYMELGLGNERKGQFFTPYHVCKLMSKITVGNVEELLKTKSYISINDCACGAGATLIAAINDIKEQMIKLNKNYQNYVLVVAQDIDTTVALMCYIQLSLLGVAGFVKIGDSLSNPISENDTYENYWFTPMYYTDIWQYRKIINNLKGD